MRDTAPSRSLCTMRSAPLARFMFDEKDVELGRILQQAWNACRSVMQGAEPGEIKRTLLSPDDK